MADFPVRDIYRHIYICIYRMLAKKGTTEESPGILSFKLPVEEESEQEEPEPPKDEAKARTWKLAAE